jgi:hypothetical protein
MRRCSCGATLDFARTEAKGKPMPIQRPPEGMPANVKIVAYDGHRGENVVRVVKPGTEDATHVSHHAVCPHAKRYRRKK